MCNIFRDRYGFGTGYTYTYTPKDPVAYSDAKESGQITQIASVPVEAPPASVSQAASVLSLDAMLAKKHESFSDSLLRLISESGMTDADCYKKANITKQHFSKIRSNAHYQPRCDS